MPFFIGYGFGLLCGTAAGYRLANHCGRSCQMRERRIRQQIHVLKTQADQLQREVALTRARAAALDSLTMQALGMTVPFGVPPTDGVRRN